MKKLLIASMIATLALTACQKQEAPAEPKAETKTTEQAPAKPADPAPKAEEHKEGEHNHAHDHAGHNHAGHDHHHDGEAYQCGDKKVGIVVHNHEGEMEAHAIIDDIEYDMPADANKPNHYTSPEEGLNNQGMVLVLADNKATFSSLDGKTTLLDCTKVAHSH